MLFLMPNQYQSMEANILKCNNEINNTWYKPVQKTAHHIWYCCKSAISFQERVHIRRIHITSVRSQSLDKALHGAISNNSNLLKSPLQMCLIQSIILFQHIDNSTTYTTCNISHMHKIILPNAVFCKAFSHIM